ncbi:MAG: hypothetical protein ACFFDW_09090 [Candidatus Thorarchaeota archaeon]
MNKEHDDLLPAIKIKLATMSDLVRMAFFSAARNNGLNFLYFGFNDKWYLGFLTGVAGYFQMRGVPMFFFIETEELAKNDRFVKYAAKEKELWGFSESTNEPTKWNYLPVIELAEKPIFF